MIPPPAAEVVRRMIVAFASGETERVDEFVADRYLDHQGLDGQPLTVTTLTGISPDLLIEFPHL